jgi:ataxia telangiectasia mutated family protein
LTQDKDVKTSVTIKERHVKLDNEEVESSYAEKEKYLELALTNYGKALVKAERGKHDLIVFRFISLWFANPTAQATNDLVGRLVSKIPSYKFVGLMYQLAARMSDETKSFWSVLSALITRTAEEHPFHALPVLLALANANADEDAANGVLGKGSITLTFWMYSLDVVFTVECVFDVIFSV